MSQDCSIFNIYGDNLDEAFDRIDRDVYEILEEAEQAFKKNGVHLGRGEEIYEVCLDSNENVVGASSMQPLGMDELDGLPLFRFSLVTLPSARRRGIARRLAKSLLEAHDQSEHTAEAWVINPHMVALLESLGMEPTEGEWSPDTPFMRRVNPAKDFRSQLSAKDLVKIQAMWTQYKQWADFIDYLYASGQWGQAEKVESQAENLLEQLEGVLTELQDESGDDTIYEYEGWGYELYPSLMEELALVYYRYHLQDERLFQHYDTPESYVRALRAIVYNSNLRTGAPVDHLDEIPDEEYLRAAEEAYQWKSGLRQRIQSPKTDSWGRRIKKRGWGFRIPPRP